jgi:leucyl/phenylalanyl-tRNA--protein transferase
MYDDAPLALRADRPLPAGLEWRTGPEWAPGLVAVGGNMHWRRLLEAYGRGLFPWYGPRSPIQWWCPDPRMVLKVADFKLRRSLRQRVKAWLADEGFDISVDRAFGTVMRACAAAPRAGQSGTWIVPAMLDAYGDLQRQGYAHSFEVWHAGELSGGLYGVAIGRMFFGESMFSRRSDASKCALLALVDFCRAHGIDWIDCQQQTEHLASLGAAPVGKAAFLEHVARAAAEPAPPSWSYDRPRLARALERRAGERADAPSF